MCASVITRTAALTGCSNDYADFKGAELAGTDGQVSQLEIADLKLATSAEAEPARSFGTLANQAEAPVDLIDLPTLFETADVQPGNIMTVTISVASDAEAVEIPVVDGAVDKYGDIVPNDAED